MNFENDFVKRGVFFILLGIFFIWLAKPVHAQQRFVWDVKLAPADNDRSADLMPADYLTVAGTVSDEDVILAKRSILSQDTELLQTFISGGGRFILCDAKNMWAYYMEDPFIENLSGYTLVGFIDYTQNVIYLLADKEHLYSSTTHELGHYLGHMLYKDYDTTDEWRSVRQAEYRGSGLDTYYSDAEEFFAESYAQYRTNPQYKRTCPIACNTIKVLEDGI